MNGRLLAFGVGWGLATSTLVSCDDKGLAAKSAAQKAEIRALELEVELLKDEYGTEPSGDPSAGLAKAEQELASTKAQVATLEAQVEELHAEREQIEKEFEAYKRYLPN